MSQPPENFDPQSPSSPHTPRPRRSAHFPILIFVLCFLFGIWIIPWIAYPISYAINRGIEKAKADAAKQLFVDMDEAGIEISAGRIVPWVVKKVGPTVVGIQTHGTKERSPEAEDFFSRRNRGDRVEHIFGEGSGVIVDPEGFILTNYHVVAGADSLLLHFSDGRTIDTVRLVGYDQSTDLAVLKIEASDLEAMQWGDSDGAQVGEPVLAIGNPFGLAHTVTQGIISAKERYNAIPDTRIIQEFLQTDAAINPGNSGGPLVNVRGELIGINTAILGQTYQGIGFAIPSVLAKKIYERIRETQGELLHGFLGVGLEPLSESYAKQNGLPSTRGAVVGAVYPNTPAHKAGLKNGDIILKWGEEEITTRSQLTHAVILTAPQTEVPILLIREGESLQIPVLVGIRPTM